MFISYCQTNTNMLNNAIITTLNSLIINKKNSLIPNKGAQGVFHDKL